ncbi:vacuolar atp synthase subunit g [Holotrichia oblita]|uniref:Vacuolar atp synthase subunit g n=2 Tax=Holotrichia oblita TaxID=644536 RepID=A0ACB9TPR5_HOLOL|nr:vacuolar atp synthase subunit g [Holotrichia oblita]KAI4468819.1 vacuolar atp synthase subunit g [Holotrichia oblita]
MSHVNKVCKARICTKIEERWSMRSVADEFGIGKAKRLKQAKEEAQDEIEKYRKERERQFREFEAKHMGSREGVQSKIEQDTKRRIDEMNRAIVTQKEAVIKEVLNLVYDIRPEIHKNYRQ